MEQSDEPLYIAYSTLRKASQPTEEETFRKVLKNSLPRNLKRPAKRSSRYPEGSGR